MLALILALVFGLPEHTTVHFYNRTEVALTLAVDDMELCTAQSSGECDSVVPYGAHHLAATYNHKELITREAPVREEVTFAVCHQSDADPICQLSGGKK